MLLLSIGAIAALVVGWQVIAFAGPVGIASGFEDDDGNLVDNATAGIDWNIFDPVNWVQSATPATPTRQADKVSNGYQFKGIEDWQSTTADSGFAGGTKQDQNCASVISAKAPNKDDLKRIYLASKTGADGHTYLNLAWVRIPLNTTSSSAHVAFEFNKGSTSCGGGSPLVQRTVGDMLIVYDFEGGGGDPVLTLRRWVTSGACEISSNSPPCWGTATNLTAGGFAEAKVNTTATALDQLAPPASLATGASVDATLGLSEFGEAGIDLTAAGVFPANTCDSFGKAYAVSRSSGSSGTAQMKDLDGPGNFNLTNCGTINIIKQTNSRGIAQDFSYTATGGLNTATFTLNDSGNSGKTQGSTAPADNSSGNTKTYSNVTQGPYTVTEGGDPTGFTFESLSCTNTGGNTTTTSNKTATINVTGSGTTTCLYTNKQNAKPSISTTLSDEEIAVGGTIHDSATLTGATPDAGGTVTYTAYTNDTCTEGARDAGTKTVTNGSVPDSDPLTFNAAGDYYWQAVYSGDAHNEGATSVCTSEHLVVGKAPSTLNTAQSFYPNDEATLSASAASGTPTGDVTFSLFDNESCSGDALYGPVSDTLDADGKASTNNTTFAISTTKTVYWKVEYEGDTKHNAVDSCTENTDLTINNGGPVTGN
jgi:hypothetical protein